MIAVVDYGRGNLGSVEKAFGRLGMAAVVTEDPSVVADAEAVVLPGDGAFQDAMDNLGARALLDPLRACLDDGRPFLGICLGYQLLFTESEEFGQCKGLDVIPGAVRRFPAGLKIPHMGWNQVEHRGDLALFDGIPSGAHFYFVHSYYPATADASLAVASCTYGVSFPAAIGRGALFATQFHPEKSQRWGHQAPRELRRLRAGTPLVTFQIIPAVDVKEGRCVRLRQGKADAETVFGEDPVAMARRWEAEGARRLHVVDLDGAFGKPRQTAILLAILEAVSIPVEVGGGLRTVEDVELVLGTGARWAIVGTRAALDPDFLGLVCRRFEDQIIIGIDASDGRVAVDGWKRVLDLEALALARDAASAGAAAIVYTDIARDGMETGPNLWSTESVARAAGIPVFASGGVSGLDDIRQLATVPGVTGVIVGRALYTGALDLRQALAEARLAARNPCSASA